MRSLTFFFSYYVFEVPGVFYTDGASQLGLAAFQALNNRARPMATVLGNDAVDCIPQPGFRAPGKSAHRTRLL